MSITMKNQADEFVLEVDSYSWLFLILASALTAVAASIAYQTTATGMAMWSVIYSSIAIS
jgi:hypothetical protein